MKMRAIRGVTLLAFLAVPPCHAWQAPAPYSLAALGTQEVAFSPNAGGDGTGAVLE
jgi:hypothetical protein